MRQVFGSENAAHDHLLEECYVAPPGVVLDKPLLIGKWGTGKTGLLLNRNAALSQILRNKNKTRDRIWYLDETGIQLQTLKTIEHISENNIHLTKRILEDLWKSEIMRAAGGVLIELFDYYGSPKGRHWTALKEIFSKTSRRSVWDLLPSAIGMVVSGEKATSATDFLNQIRSLHDETAFHAIQECLHDISAFPIQPVVAIEPIETPTSTVENETDLAQTLVTCLLNVFYKNFAPHDRQLLKVEISIPWHRFNRDHVGEPQKLFPFIGRFKWTKTSLREFINKRIEWEFRRVRRQFTPKGSIDGWSALFPELIRNSHTFHQESSFEYFLRHSQYRVRDLLRFAREAIETEAVNKNVSVDDILLGRGGEKISLRSIRASVVRVCKGTAIERVQEGDRRFPGLAQHIELLRGINVPFKLNEAKKRFEKRVLDNIGFEFMEQMGKFWNAGVIGVQLTGITEQAITQLTHAFEKSSISPFERRSDSASFYVFEHSTDRSLADIINTFDNTQLGQNDHADILVNIVLHPMFFEHLDARVDDKHPVGV